MHSRLAAVLILLLAIAAACNGAPPTQIVIVVTATPSDTTFDDGTVSANGSSPTPDGDFTREPESSSTPAPTATPDPFPTPTSNRMQVAEQLFEQGRMFWLQPTKEIWVLLLTEENGGTWTVYKDTFEDGEMEFDPDTTPPEGLYQPERGFGKLWRENPEIREQLGWAITPEFGYVSGYEYHPGGAVNTNGEYIAGPGYHVWYSLYGEAFRFNEIDGTWQFN